MRPPLLFLYILNILSLTVCVSESVNLNVNIYLAYLTIPWTSSSSFSFPFQGLFWKIRTYVRYNQKRARKSSKRAQLWVFPPHFSKFRAFRILHPPKRHVFLEFLVEKKVFRFAKRALRAATARNKWFAQQFNWLIFVWAQHWHLMG